MRKEKEVLGQRIAGEEEERRDKDKSERQCGSGGTRGERARDKERG